MGANGAVKLKRVIDNVEKVLAIELFTAAQAIDFRKPLKTAELLEKTIVEYRKLVKFNDQDRILHDDMIQTVQFLNQFIPA
jgi:histidine ammonia-lyase